MNNWLTSDEAAKRSRWRFLASDVDAWLEMGRVTGVRRPRRRSA